MPESGERGQRRINRPARSPPTATVADGRRAMQRACSLLGASALVASGPSRAQNPGMHAPVILASASPRRRALLEAAGVPVVVLPADIDETPQPNEDPRALVARLARAKSDVVADPHAVVVAADTTVALGERVFNKPVDDADAAAMLRTLAGRTHDVATGWCVRRGTSIRAGVVCTKVTFRPLDDADIRAYLAAGEHRDKAGAYGIQGTAAVLVERVEGSLTNVIGLPLTEVLDAIAAVRGGA
jgi:septum formation protein